MTDEGSDVTISTSEQSLVDSAIELAKRFQGKRFGEIRVVRSEAGTDKDDEGNDIIRLMLVLSDPKSDTWPPDDVLSLRRETINLLNEIGLHVSVYVNFMPETNERQEDDPPDSSDD